MHYGRRGFGERSGRRQRKKRIEEFAYVLDFQPFGLPSLNKPHPFVQLIGEDYFTLLEAAPRRGAEMEIGERVYIGPEEALRFKIYRVTKELEYDDLTSIARAALPDIVRKIIESKEEVFVEFYNIADAVTLRLHSLELLPGIGKKTALKIIDARRVARFQSFEDIRSRVGIDPVTPLVKRILDELSGGQRYYLFVAPPKSERVKRGADAPLWLDYIGKAMRSLAERKEKEFEGR